MISDTLLHREHVQVVFFDVLLVIRSCLTIILILNVVVQEMEVKSYIVIAYLAINVKQEDNVHSVIELVIVQVPILIF